MNWQDWVIFDWVTDSWSLGLVYHTSDINSRSRYFETVAILALQNKSNNNMLVSWITKIGWFLIELRILEVWDWFTTHRLLHRITILICIQNRWKKICGNKWIGIIPTIRHMPIGVPLPPCIWHNITFYNFRSRTYWDLIFFVHS